MEGSDNKSTGRYQVLIAEGIELIRKALVAIVDEESDMVQGVLDLKDTRIYSIMIPRTDISSASINSTLGEVIDLVDGVFDVLQIQNIGFDLPLKPLLLVSRIERQCPVVAADDNTIGLVIRVEICRQKHQARTAVSHAAMVCEKQDQAR